MNVLNLRWKNEYWDFSQNNALYAHNNREEIVQEGDVIKKNEY